MRAADTRLGRVTHWTFEPLQVVPVLLLAALYARRVQTLRGRGTAPPGWRICLFALGIVLLLVALASPIDYYVDSSFGVHMMQHILLGDLAPLAILGGLTRPVLRPLLRFVHPLRRLFHPFAALGLWALNLFIWHLPFLYETALRHDAVHALEHICFFTAGVLVWWPLIQPVPMRHRLTGLSTFGYIGAAKLGLGALGLFLTWSSVVVYTYYEHVPRIWGLSTIDDQRVGGAIMMVEQSLVLVTAFAILFVRMLLQSEEDERRRERFEDAAAI